jgi:DNA repair protein RecN (Recombination protein N)
MDPPMLLELHISNLAIVDQAHLTFQRGLNILTGETGAGKSIIIGAMGFLLGDRAAKDSIRDGCDEARVEGLFSLDDSIGISLDRLGAPRGEEGRVHVSRSLSRSGRSRAMINGRTATLPMLQELGRVIVDIHGQNEHQALLRPDVQMDLLDAFSKSENQLAAYREAFSEARGIDRALKKMIEEHSRGAEILDLLDYQIRELREASLRIDEDRELLDRRLIVSQTERLHLLAQEARDFLVSSEPSALDLLGEIGARLKNLAELDPGLAPTVELFRTQVSCCKDIADTLRDYIETLESNPSELARIEDRLFQLESIKRKYGGSVESALARLAEAEGKRDALEHFDERIQDLEGRRDPAWERVERSGKIMSEMRHQGARELERMIAKEFSSLKLQHCLLEIQMTSGAGRPEESWTENGGDDVRFLMVTNPGEHPKPLERVLSGGEISRIMLALRTVLAEIDRTPVLIFDEIDAGIGGGVAESVGIRLKRLAKGRQVLCVTHLAQIAAQAHQHIVVGKEVREGRSTVYARIVEGTKREEEIARMLGGIRITSVTRRHAREMLQEAR